MVRINCIYIIMHTRTLCVRALRYVTLFSAFCFFIWFLFDIFPYLFFFFFFCSVVFFIFWLCKYIFIVITIYFLFFKFWCAHIFISVRLLLKHSNSSLNCSCSCLFFEFVYSYHFSLVFFLIFWNNISHLPWRPYIKLNDFDKVAYKRMKWNAQQCTTKSVYLVWMSATNKYCRDKHYEHAHPTDLELNPKGKRFNHLAHEHWLHQK